MSLNISGGARPSGYRTYVTYDNVKTFNKEVATSFHWELIFDTKPTGVYIPPDVLMNIRLKSVTPPSDNFGGLASIETELHGWKIYQNGINGDYSGEFTGTFQDFIDQSLEYAFREMCYEVDRPLDHTSKPKSELMWNATLLQLNNQDWPIKKWVMKDCLLSSFSASNSFDSSASPLGEVSIGWKAQMCYVEQMNATALT